MARHTSKLKSTPPMGAPNATEMPAAAAADKTSRFLAAIVSMRTDKLNGELTFVVTQVLKWPHDNISTAACDMNKRAFFA